MPDSSDVEAALVTKLQADATLAAQAQAGQFVFMDAAPAGASRFVIVSLVDEHDEPMFGGRAFEEAVYLVKFVELSVTGSAPHAKPAAARIDALLEQGTLTVSGYTLVAMRRVERVRQTEVDEVDESIRWHHRGGRYQVVVSG